MIVNRVLFIAYLLAILLKIKAENVEVVTNEGTVLGRTSQSEKLNKTMYMFLSIPYAEPPKRFELSVSKSNWTGVLNCTFERPQCVQGATPVEGAEDCLFLSVASPDLTGKAPVLVWIHGGGFISGNGSLISLPPELFLEEGLVVVGVQYRLGIFGFMSTGDMSCPGNLGLKDQTLALQWVQRNIARFGGDPKRVTIWGQSAGAASVSLHLTSARSKGLFHGVIMNSGVSLSLWSLSRNAVDLAYKIGTTLNAESTNSSELVQNLKKIDYVTLQQVSINLTYAVFLKYPLAGIPLGPVIEIPHKTAFLTVKSDHSLILGQFSRVPLLLGYTSNEFGLMGPELLLGSVPVYEEDPKTIVPADIISNKNLTEAGLKIRKEFFGNAPNIPTDQTLINFFNIDQFGRPVNRFVFDVKKHVYDTYLYQFSYEGDVRKALGITVSGVLHAEELAYLFKVNFPFSKRDLEVRSKMVKMWSNFCKCGKPIPVTNSFFNYVSWLPARTTPRPLIFNINYKNKYIINPYLQKLIFYDRQIYAKYGQGIYDTY